MIANFSKPTLILTLFEDFRRYQSWQRRNRSHATEGEDGEKHWLRREPGGLDEGRSRLVI